MTRSRLLPSLPILMLPAPVWADHGGPLSSAPLRPFTVALLAGGLSFVGVLLFVVIVRLIARLGRGGE